jgi:hypothetical protein
MVSAIASARSLEVRAIEEFYFILAYAF